MTKFILTVEIGNDAVQNADDISELLKHYGGKIRTTGKYDIGTIYDQNGNVVGEYRTVEDTEVP